MKILVTGSNGLLGSALKKTLGNNHIYHTREDANLLNTAKTNKYIKKCVDEGVDTIIHVAAIVGGLKANMTHGDRFFSDNYKLNHNVLNAAFENKVPNLVNVLSTCIFPATGIYPLTKGQIDIGPPHESNKGYALAKRLSGYETKILGRMLNANWFSVIPSNLYGPNDNFNLDNSHLIAGMIHRAYLAKKNNEKFLIWGDGSPRRQFVYAEDLANLILWSINGWKSTEHCMMMGEEEYSVMDIANIIKNRFGFSADEIYFDPSQPAGQFRRPARTDICDFKFKKIEDGLHETIDWFIENYEIARK